MKVVVFGANGKVGSLVVEKLLANGDSVTAFVHGTSNFTEHKNLHIYPGDIYDKTDVAAAIQGSDAVVSALGSWGTPKKDILTTGMTHIIPALNAAGIKRVVSLTGSDSRADGDSVGMMHGVSHTLLSVLAGKVLDDGERHIALLQRSNLDWTVLRSPVMTESGDPARFTINTKRSLPWQSIHRHSVAHALVDLLKTTDFNQQSPFIHREK